MNKDQMGSNQGCGLTLKRLAKMMQVTVRALHNTWPKQRLNECKSNTEVNWTIRYPRKGNALNGRSFIRMVLLT